MELTYPPNSELLMSLQRDLTECNDSELRAFRVLMDKLKAGRHHGPLDIKTDKRNWRFEARMELADACWYLAFAEVAEGA